LAIATQSIFYPTSIVGKQLGINSGSVTIGFDNSSYSVGGGVDGTCVVIAIDSSVTGNLTFDNIGVKDVDGTTLYDTLGAGIVYYNTKKYKLVGTQMVKSDFSRQNTDNNFAS
jgi:hypothetical protein